MSIQKKSLISTLKTAKKANVASGSAHEIDTKGSKVASMRQVQAKATVHARSTVHAKNSINAKSSVSAKNVVNAKNAVNTRKML